jgi:hypothetical protein
METKKTSFLVKTFVLAVFTIIFTGTGFCQNNKTQGTNQQQKQQSLTPQQATTTQQATTIKNILSKYDPKKLTAADAKAIHEKLRQAGIHAGPETRDVIIAAGFDPDKLRTLDPPPGGGNQGGHQPMTEEEKLKAVETNIIKPLSLNSSQSQSVLAAFKEFFAGMETLRKSQGEQRGPVDRSKAEPLKQKRDEKIKKVLTSAQFSKYQEIEKSLHPHNGQNPDPGSKQGH